MAEQSTRNHGPVSPTPALTSMAVREAAAVVISIATANLPILKSAVADGRRRVR
ncbi:MAG: hypothetical protein ABIS86_03385 [Streptosporangiaceae bacterium]